jgi:ABC-type Mn2+/Zn2+ transport system ATPase subunit
MSEAVSLTGVRAGYGRRIVLDDLDLSVARGEVVGLVGPSGSGKTTLLRLLTGTLPPLGGEVRVFGDRVAAGAPSHHVGYVPQLGTADAAFPLTARQIVLLGLTAGSARRPWWTRQEQAQADRLLDRLGLGEHTHQRLDELSGGQQQRVLLARALVRGSELLVLDEPTSGVDLAARAEILDLLAELAGQGITIVLTTHDLSWVAALLPRIVCLAGRIVADGPPDAVLTTEVLAATFGTQLRVVHDQGAVLLTDQRARPLEKLRP